MSIAKLFQGQVQKKTVAVSKTPAYVPASTLEGVGSLSDWMGSAGVLRREAVPV